ncbi:MAG: hypothetical protein Q8N23_13170 [Archangium sp.]|nr:hypothetical protein [Archangium sp.]MDP3153622.1 hypothetical protein [Archangium sp.]MDP3576387.1 hypothetical protein [Archangium sp.]
MKWFAALWLLLCGCPVPDPETDAGTFPDGGPCPREFVLGTETDTQAFEALTEGAEVTIIRGFQGGHHVWISVRAFAKPQTGTLTYTLRSGGAVVSAPLRIDLSQAFLDPIACGWERRSDPLTFESSGEPFRGMSGEVELRWESFGATPVVVKRSVQLR